VADEYRDGNVGRDGDPAPSSGGLSQLPSGHHLRLPRRHGLLRRADAAVGSRTRRAPAAPGPDRLHRRRRHDRRSCTRLRAVPRPLGHSSRSARRDLHCAGSSSPRDWAEAGRPLRYRRPAIRQKQGHSSRSRADTKYLPLGATAGAASRGLLRWHWQKAGTIELVHDITKTSSARPSRPAAASAPTPLVPAEPPHYNVLSALKSLACAPALSNRPPKRLRFTLFTLGRRLVTHRAVVLRVSAARSASPA